MCQPLYTHKVIFLTSVKLGLFNPHLTEETTEMEEVKSLVKLIKIGKTGFKSKSSDSQGHGLRHEHSLPE